MEYAGGPFALFFLAEYANILFINALTGALFLGTLYSPAAPALASAKIMVKLVALAGLFL